MARERSIQFLISVQNELRFLSHSFINGFSLTKTGKVLSPLIHREQNFFKDIFTLLQNEDELEMGEVSLKSLLQFDQERKSLSEKVFAEILAGIFKKYYQQLEGLSISKHCRHLEDQGVDPDEWRTRTEGQRIFDPINKIEKLVEDEAKPWVSHLFLQGSYSTLDFSYNFSDLDLTMILRKDVLGDPQKILALRRIVFNIIRSARILDPLQHHGVFIIPQEEMKWYNENHFPLELFKYSMPLVNEPTPLIFEVWENDPTILFTEFAKYFRSLSVSSDFLKSNAYELKRFYAKILLLPALFLEALTKTYIYKRESFEKARKMFSKKDWKIIDDVSLVRSSWKYGPADFSFFIRFLARWPNPHTLFLLSRLSDKIFQPSVEKYFRSEQIEEVNRLLDRMEEKLY